eukprot:scaffold307598_cov13-Prasinocladus_malaysianus.AAC.1
MATGLNYIDVKFIDFESDRSIMKQHNKDGTPNIELIMPFPAAPITYIYAACEYVNLSQELHEQYISSQCSVYSTIVET